MDIPCRQSPKPKEGAPVEAHSVPVDQRNIIRRIFSPSSIDWLDEKVNRVGPRAKSIEHCVSFDFEVTESGFEQFYPGMYGNIWCPDASMKSHPFSVTHVPGRTDQLRIIFRVFGRWTDLLARSLIQLPCPGHQQEYLPIPKIMMDGWHGPDHLVGSALNHDKVIIVTAGIGITAFLSMFTEMIELLCFKEDGMFIKMDEIQGAPITKEFSLQWTCRDENLIKYITDEYFQPLIEKAERKGRDSGDDDGAKCSRCSIHIHRTGPAGQKTIKPSSLWMSFRDKTERGIAEIDFGLLGTFGTPWKPYRFSFGKFDSLMEHIPSIIMFVLILWLSYLLTIEIHFSLIYNPFGITQATKYFLRIFGILPTLFVAFGVGWIGHVLVDWSENVSVHNKNTRTEKTSDDGSANNNGYTEKTCDDGSADNNGYNEKTCDDGSVDSNGYDVFPKFTKSLIQPEENENGKGDGDICLKNEMISLTSTAGRPPFNELVEAGDTLPVSTGIFLCGPEKMIESCKKAAGLNCMIAAERLQMFAKGNKFVFYEEKFEW
jgi:NAD(P)H-flavin reductase